MVLVLGEGGVSIDWGMGTVDVAASSRESNDPDIPNSLT